MAIERKDDETRPQRKPYWVIKAPKYGVIWQGQRNGPVFYDLHEAVAEYDRMQAEVGPPAFAERGWIIERQWPFPRQAVNVAVFRHTAAGRNNNGFGGF